MARSSEDVEIYTAKYNAIRSCLNEKGKRLWSAVEAKNYGYGGVTVLSEATKLSRPTMASITQTGQLRHSRNKSFIYA